MNLRLLLSIGFVFTHLITYAQFELKETPVSSTLLDVHFVNENVGVAVGEDGKIIRSTDGGETWSVVMDQGEDYLTDVNFFDENTGLAISLNTMYRTTDAGLSWSPMSIMEVSNISDLEIINSTTCMITSAPSGLWKSENQGENWTQVPNNLGDIFSSHIAFADLNTGYGFYGNNTEYMYKTTDGGSNWEQLPIESGQDITVIEEIHFLSPDHGFRAGWYVGHLMYTNDGGINWESPNYLSDGESMPFTEQLLDIHFDAETPSDYYASGWYGKIFKSTDQGLDWYEVPSNVPLDQNLYGIFFIGSDLGWAVGSDGVVVKTTNGGGTVSIEELDTDYNLELFPNPTADILNIKNPDQLPIDQIIVWSLDGKKVMEAIRFPLNMNNLPKGVYEIEIRSEGNRISTTSISRQ